jgi:DnaJ-domain-containing protein 1
MPQPVEQLGPYEALDLPPKLRWDEGEIEAAHERLARRCHPDLFRAHRAERVLLAAKAAMRALNDACRTIRDAEGRLQYVLSAMGQMQVSTRTVPEGLQDSVQILERLLTTIEEARARGDRSAWEAEQDHLASLQVKLDDARQRSEQTMRGLAAAWDAAVATGDGEWPEMDEAWTEQALTWVGERAYLNAMATRMGEACRWPVDVPA